MKRAVEKEEQQQQVLAVDFAIPVYELLPREIWPNILCHLTMWQRYQFRTVCSEWGKHRGLIDQSVTQLVRRNIEPLTFSRMCNLTHLDTAYTSYVSTAITEERLKHLSSADFRGHGTIHCDFGALSKLCNLTSLSISGCVAEFVDSLCRMSLLRTLELNSSYGEKAVGCCEGLRVLSGLTSLRLSDICMTDEDLLSFKELRHLELFDSTHITPNCVSKLTALESLTLLAQALWKDGMLRPLTRLTALDLSYNDNVQDKHISHLTSLFSLNVSDALMLSSNVLHHFPHLTRLILCEEAGDSSGGMDDDGIALNLRELTNLRELQYDADVHFMISDDTLCCLTNLERLHIHNNKDRVTLDSLSLLVNLTDLELSSTDLSQLCLSLLPISLRKLSLRSCTYWATKVPKLLARLTRLTDLTLGNAEYLGRSMLSLAQMTPYKALERIYYTDSSTGSNLPFVPSHIQLIKY
jgi:hypothetical protein